MHLDSVYIFKEDQHFLENFEVWVQLGTFFRIRDGVENWSIYKIMKQNLGNSCVQDKNGPIFTFDKCLFIVDT